MHEEEKTSLAISMKHATDSLKLVRARCFDGISSGARAYERFEIEQSDAFCSLIENLSAAERALEELSTTIPDILESRKVNRTANIDAEWNKVLQERKSSRSSCGL